MAKLNIHDLAKELKREESEIISLCSSKGMSGVTRATMLQDTMVEEVRKAFKKPAESADAAADKDGAPKKKLRLLFHPENSTKPISKKKRPDSAKKPEGDKAEKSVDKQEKAAERTESTKPAEKAQEMAKTEAPKETMTRENTKNDRNDSRSTNDGNRRDNSRRDGGNGQNGQRRDGNGQGGQRREGGYGQRDGQRRDGNNQGGYGQRRDGNGQGGYGQRDGQRRDGNNQGGYGQRRDGNGQGGYGQRDGQRRDGNGQGGYGQRDGQRRDGNGQGGYGQRDGQRRDGNGQGGYGQRDGQRRDGNGQGGYGQRRDGARGQRTERENLDSMGTGMTKSEARGGKGLNKKEREIREKERQNQEKNTRFTENTRNISKMKQQNSKKPEPQPKAEEDDGIKTITIPETLTLAELAEAMKLQPAALVKSLFMKGTMMTINAELTFEQAEEIALEFNYICEKEVKVDVIEELLREEDDPEETKVSRPPVVCVMGHVDHGKTSLLDAIRSTNVISREAGGITQHIGAYMVKCNGQDITFLDTPGHEAFTAMRMRGAQATDIAVLVVAADDGVMPQTIEAINHAKAAGVDIIVAVNKIDKPTANIERVKQELSEYELIAEDWGGQTIFVPVSAKTHEGIDTLLEMILLDAELKDLKANPNRKARGLVIEAQLDKGRGPVATILVQKGTLHVGDNVAAGSCYGKVRAMIDDKGRRVKEATPSMPVEILGLNDVPNAGEIFVNTENEKEARSFAETFIKENREKLLADTKTQLTLDSLNSQIKEGSLKELNLIVKADVQGSVEAVKQSLLKLSNEEVVVKIIHSGVGAINESDVSLASASNAIIIGFNIRPDAMAKSVAEREKVEIRLYRVIYQAIADVEAAMKGMLDPIYEEKVIGHAQVRQIFKASGVGNIAGSYVTDGMFQRGCKIRISREGEQIYEGSLASLKRFKDDVKEVKEGYECGLVFEKFNDIQIDDIVEAYIMEEVPR
ncbi:MAG: translation initiation factor IF-2 [Clostridiales bacterium 41_12_two_minus]|nr:MAG: translation initiation factor IF-2 [Clostridiales bacterium 41_12_two_minus]